MVDGILSTVQGIATRTHVAYFILAVVETVYLSNKAYIMEVS